MSNTNTVMHTPQTQAIWTPPEREPSADLDRTAFLNLLITQLRYQDPLNPMDDREFIAQMAQFSALEQMMNLNQTFERTQAFGMIGKVIDASFFCQTHEEQIDIEGGLVMSVRRDRDSLFLVVAGERGEDGERRMIDVPFDAVREVSEDFFLSHQLNEIFSQVQGQRAADLMGSTVMGFAVHGDDLEFVEGRVDSVSMQGDVAILHVGNRELLFPRDIFAVAPNQRLIGSQAFTHGVLQGVDVTNVNNNTRLYLQFAATVDGNPVNRRVHAQHINQVTSALNYVGHNITFGDVDNERVTSITMQGGVPFLNTASGGQVDFMRYLAQRGGTPTHEPPSNANPNTEADAS